jgi:NADH-quinone oxidoreductase subunit A
MVALSQLASPSRPTSVKKCALRERDPAAGNGTRERFSVKFYLVAILFIVFDLETVFLIPWAVAMRELGWSGFFAASIFVVS